MAQAARRLGRGRRDVCDVTTDKVDVEIPSPAAGRLERILVEPGDTVAVGTPLAEIDARRPPGRGPSRGAPAADTRGTARQPARAERRTTATAPASTRRWSGGSRTSTASTSSRSRAPGSAAASERRTCSPTSRLARRVRRQAPERRLHTESPYQEAEAPHRARPRPRPAARPSPPPTVDGAGPSGASRCRRCARRSPRHMVGEPAHGGPLHDDRRGRLRAGRGRAAAELRAAMRAARRQPHLPGVRGAARRSRRSQRAPAC